MKHRLNGTLSTKTKKNSRRPLAIETAVKERYARGAAVKEDALCCPVLYNPELLKVVPAEILEKDYGCGDPSPYLQKGDTVLDLGSGGGKICYIASQIVGRLGSVIGVDFNPSMLALARKYQHSVGEKIGWHNVTFLRGRIQDLRTNLDHLEALLSKNPPENIEAWDNLHDTLKHDVPLIPDESIDVIVSNCVLNLVQTDEKKNLFSEMHRVLKRGGRIAISDIVSDEPSPLDLQNDTTLWSGCISGAFQERDFLKAFENAGFFGITIEKRDVSPWKIVKGIEYRSVTVTAYKGKEGPCFERNQAVIYKGPWKQVEDDDHHILKRGVPTAVCDKTFQILTKAPYQTHIIPVHPHKNIPLSSAKEFDCSRISERHPHETKGKSYKKTILNSSCMDGGCC